MPETTFFGTKIWFEKKFENINRFGDRWGHSFRYSQQSRMSDSFRLASLVLRMGATQVLDIGCATADFSRRLVGMGRTVRACDVSHNAIAYCKKNIPDIVFQTETLPELSYPSSKFDLVCALEVLHYLNEPELVKAIDEIYRVTKKGGYFLFSGVIYGDGFFEENEISTQIAKKFKLILIRHNHARLYSFFEKYLFGLILLEDIYRRDDYTELSYYFTNPRFRSWLAKSWVKLVGRVLLNPIAICAKLLLQWSLPFVFLAALSRLFLPEWGKSHVYVLAKRV